MSPLHMRNALLSFMYLCLVTSPTSKFSLTPSCPSSLRAYDTLTILLAGMPPSPFTLLKLPPFHLSPSNRLNNLFINAYCLSPPPLTPSLPTEAPWSRDFFLFGYFQDFVCLAIMSRSGIFSVINEICGLNKFIHKHLSSSAESEESRGHLWFSRF